MKRLCAALALAFATIAAHAQYQEIKLIVFGMDCAPCAHAIHVSMKGIPGVNTVDVDLNTGLVSIQLAPANAARMAQFNAAVEKNGFAHKDAMIVAKGTLTGTAAAPAIQISGTGDRYALVPSGPGSTFAFVPGKAVTIRGTLPEAAKGKVPDSLRFDSVTEDR